MIARIGLLMLIALSAATANGQPPSTIAVGLEDFQTAQHIRCQAVNGSYAWTVVKNGNLQTAGALEGIHRIAKTNRGFTVTTQEGNLEARYLIRRKASPRFGSSPSQRVTGNTPERCISIGTPVTGTSLWKPIWKTTWPAYS